jgi:hypothetical protein
MNIDELKDKYEGKLVRVLMDVGGHPYTGIAHFSADGAWLELPQSYAGKDGKKRQAVCSLDHVVSIVLLDAES